MEYNKLIELLKGHKVYLQMHNFPDPDALASAYGLQQFLKAFDIESKICYDGSIDKLNTKRMVTTFEIEVKSADQIAEMASNDYVVTVDGQKNNANFTDFIGNEVACIDHHPLYNDYEYKYKDIRIVGACSSIIAEYFYNSDIEIDRKTATALLYGIRMDTASFSRGVTDLDIEMFGYLHPIVDNNLINSMFNNNMELEDLRAYGAAIENIIIYDNIGFASIPFDCPDALIAMVSDFILGLDVVEVSVVYSKREGGYKFSIRNETEYAHSGYLVMNALEGVGNGGGHFTMAGGYIPSENLEKLGIDVDYAIRERFIKVINKQICEYRNNNSTFNN